MEDLSYYISIQIGRSAVGGFMKPKLKVTVTMDAMIIREIDEISKKQGESRSRIIENAVKAWRQKQQEKELIEGYLFMAREDREVAEANLEAGTEALE